MSNRDGAFFMQAQQHLRSLVSQVVHQAIVQAAVTRAWIERDIGDLGCAQRVRDHVAAEAGIVDARRNRPVERRQASASRSTQLCAIASVTRQSEGSQCAAPGGGSPASNRITRPVARTSRPPGFSRKVNRLECSRKRTQIEHRANCPQFCPQTQLLRIELMAAAALLSSLRKRWA